MNAKIWELRYVAGNPKLFSLVTTSGDSPYRRAEALAAAQTVTGNCGGWRVWVEHSGTGERIFESEAEKQHQADQNHASLNVHPARAARLSAAQARVLKWLQGGWSAVKANGSAIHINGQRICNIDTITSLNRLGLVEQDGDYHFKATQAGKVFDLRHFLKT